MTREPARSRSRLGAAQERQRWSVIKRRQTGRNMKIIRNEKGIALLVALMVLIMLTLSGMAAILTTTTEVNIAGNEKQATQALYLAEAGVSQVKAFFENPSSFNPPAGSIECLDKDDDTIGEENCNMTHHNSQVAVKNAWPSSFFDRRRLDAEGAPSFIGTGGRP